MEIGPRAVHLLCLRPPRNAASLPHACSRMRRTSAAVRCPTRVRQQSPHEWQLHRWPTMAGISTGSDLARFVIGSILDAAANYDKSGLQAAPGLRSPRVALGPYVALLDFNSCALVALISVVLPAAFSLPRHHRRHERVPIVGSGSLEPLPIGSYKRPSGDGEERSNGTGFFYLVGIRYSCQQRVARSYGSRGKPPDRTKELGRAYAVAAAWPP